MPPSASSPLPPSVSISWPQCWRILGTLYPPVPLFEDAGIDPADWPLLLSIAGRTDPAVLIAAGSYDQIPVSRRISGPGAIVAIGPFAHASPAWPSRFTDGRYGVWHGGETFEVALMETAFHFERFMRDTWQPAGARDFFELTTKVAGTLHDLSVGFEACLNPDDYSVSQALAKRLRAENSDGIVCPSVRWPRGRACALFYPDLVKLPVVVGRQLRYRWDGERMTDYLVWGQPDWTSLPVL